MRLELDEVNVYIAKNRDQDITRSEKMTQTDIELTQKARTTPNGTSPCNHPTLACQVLVAL